MQPGFILAEFHTLKPLLHQSINSEGGQERREMEMRGWEYKRWMSALLNSVGERKSDRTRSCFVTGRWYNSLCVLCHCYIVWWGRNVLKFQRSQKKMLCEMLQNCIYPVTMTCNRNASLLYVIICHVALGIKVRYWVYLSSLILKNWFRKTSTTV